MEKVINLGIPHVGENIFDNIDTEESSTPINNDELLIARIGCVAAGKLPLSGISL